MKHSKGPWKTERGQIRSAEDCLIFIAFHANGRTNADTQEANANLAAAAPEMLEMLKYLADELPEKFSNDIRSIEQIIAKAEGKT